MQINADSAADMIEEVWIKVNENKLIKLEKMKPSSTRLTRPWGIGYKNRKPLKPMIRERFIKTDQRRF